MVLPSLMRDEAGYLAGYILGKIHLSIILRHDVFRMQTYPGLPGRDQLLSPEGAPTAIPFEPDTTSHPKLLARPLIDADE